MTTSDDKARAAAASIWSAWERGQRLEQLPASCRPATLVEGYAAQAMLEAVSGCASRGWKIAATNGCGLSAGDIVTTGVCGRPCAVHPGDSVCADFGALGQVTLTLAD